MVEAEARIGSLDAKVSELTSALQTYQRQAADAEAAHQAAQQDLHSKCVSGSTFHTVTVASHIDQTLANNVNSCFHT